MLRFILALSLIHSVIGQCNPNDKLIGDLCYTVSTSKQTPEESEGICLVSGRYLAVIHTSIQANFLATLVKAQTGADKFWIGLHRVSGTSNFRWTDGTPMTWSNFDSSLPKDEHYVAESTSNGKWQTVDEAHEFYYVCSYTPKYSTPVYKSTARPTTVPPTTVPTTRPQVTRSPTTGKCLDNQDIEIQGGCYKFVPLKLTFEDARNWCHYRNPVTASYLAYVPNQTVDKSLAAYARSEFETDDGNFWIGLSRSSGSSWKWDNGLPVGFTNFGTRTGQNYAAESIVNGKWDTFNDEEKNFFVCSYNPASPPTFPPF
ncbi:hypothetical protein GCK72_016217 [Caenorhabditis remanei]|uniref:C-type lectin domain-containing protein n=1 Tax=Caenorhabditis remanei TaxID=31234 RepID=A0A6A5GW69_CAERE|nr:hypothetical protein GCK72_016217 [Caenorhabditis remanei]KAF1759750.1 hypothetical protein GCK72_016217 [Caenorhabditis remanei]